MGSILKVGCHKERKERGVMATAAPSETSRKKKIGEKAQKASLLNVEQRISQRFFIPKLKTEHPDSK